MEAVGSCEMLEISSSTEPRRLNNTDEFDPPSQISVYVMWV